MAASPFVARALRTGLIASGILLALSLFVTPLGIAGLFGVGVTFLVIAVHGARQHGAGWGATVAVSAFLFLWAAASLSAWNFWGVGFDLADAGRAVPGAITAATFGSAALAAAAFVGMVGVGIVVTVTLWRRCAHAGVAPAHSANAAR